MSVTVKIDPGYPDVDRWPRADLIQVTPTGALVVEQAAVLGEPLPVAAYAPGTWATATIDGRPEDRKPLA